MTVQVTFDQGHGNLIDPLSDAVDTRGFSKLVTLLQEEAGLTAGDSIEGRLTPISLSHSRVFVLAAPTGQLTHDEIDYIWRFVQKGGGVLLLNNAEAFQYQVYSMNALAERAGCRFGFYAAHEPLSVTEFGLHYIVGNVNEVRFGETGEQFLSRIVPIQGDIALQPIASNEYSLLLAVGKLQEGRVIVAGSTAMFSNKHVEKPGNRQLALNTFRWLAKTNPFEFTFATPHREIDLGQRHVFEIGLRNPTHQPTRIQELDLDSSVNDNVSPQPVQDIVLYPDRDGSEVQRVHWEIEPQGVLGDHVLRLRFCLEQGEILFQHVSGFTVVVPGHSRLAVSKKDLDTTIDRGILVDEPFEVTGIGAISTLKERSVEFTPRLDYPYKQIYEVQSDWPDALRWTLKARTAGTYPITLRVEETGQTVQTSVGIRESAASQIKAINGQFVKPIDDEIRRILPAFGSALTAPGLAEIPFRLLPIEDYIAAVFPFEPAAQQIWDVVDAAFWEDRENERVVTDLLYNLAPMYSPRIGAFIPFAPDLVSRLLNTGTSHSRELIINFLKGDDLADIEMRRHIASYLSHEKYGHGFFYTYTKLGQQLAILDRHRFRDKYAELILRKPYPKELYSRYRQAIKVLQHSALIVNEGFAAWLELNILHRMNPEIHAIISERIEFMRESQTLRDVRRDSIYFDRFPPASGLNSPYEEGRQYLHSIQNLYPEEYGVKCATQAFLVSTAIPLGITDNEEAPNFALPPEVLKDTILEGAEGNARSDLRLWRISRVLEDTEKSVLAAQEQLQCHRFCLHPECPVRLQIAHKLGWEDRDA